MKKGQITMESLLLYGAAILVVLLAIAALTYFGVLDMGRWLPQTCNLEGTGVLSCEEYFVSSGADDVELAVKNTGQKTLTIKDASFIPDDSALATGGCSMAGGDTDILPGAQEQVTISCGNIVADAGDRIKGRLEIKHIVKDGGMIEMVTSGELSATVVS